MRRLLRVAPALLLALSLASLLQPRGAETVPLYAAREGLMCKNCHFDPNGGGPRNEFGFTFARNRHSLAPEDSTSEWADLAVVNRLGESVPIFVGVNQRFMLFANSTIESDSLDRLGFFNMENSLHLAFQPHPRLTLVYTRDGFDGGSRSQEAWGMIGGFPLNGYFRAGRIRTPFGLRLDDHTVATRNSFLDFSTQQPFLPYDPREPDMGIEIGADNDLLFGRIAYLNGGSHPLFNPFASKAQAFAAKLGMNRTWYQGGISFYDDFHREPFFGPGPPELRGTRATRWGYYGLAHAGPVALIAEVAAGTDENVLGDKINRLAWFAELDYAPLRWLNFRARWDHLELDRSTVEAVRDANTHDRYALEGEVVPVPFAELRWTLRRIDHKEETAFGAEDETQGYLQFHFSY
jgi:hypothetical protein